MRLMAISMADPGRLWSSIALRRMARHVRQCVPEIVKHMQYDDRPDQYDNQMGFYVLTDDNGNTHEVKVRVPFVPSSATFKYIVRRYRNQNVVAEESFDDDEEQATDAVARHFTQIERDTTPAASKAAWKTERNRRRRQREKTAKNATKNFDSAQ